MTLEHLLRNALSEWEQISCCHEGSAKCNCYKCLEEGYYSDGGENYNCQKKTYFYICKYAASYASEYYEYFTKSRILEEYHGTTVKILSLGCGISPEYYAIQKYMDDQGISICFEYIGVDSCSTWSGMQLVQDGVSYYDIDVICDMDLSRYDVIILGKLISTLYRNKALERFLNLFVGSLRKTMKEDLLLLFNDINHRYWRDPFDEKVSPLFRSARRYYMDVNNAWNGNGEWIPLSQRPLHISPVQHFLIDPMNEHRKTVVFEYRGKA